MATHDKSTPPPQSAEDMFGRPTDVRHEEPEPGPSREQQTAHRIPRVDTPDPLHRKFEDEAEQEAAYGGVGEIPDGDGVRSDLGTNPLPEDYWSSREEPDER